MGTQSQKRRGRPRTFDRGPVIEKAMACYWREGIHTLSLNEVCRRTGLSKPALYREFGDEDGLMEAALVHYQNVVLNRLVEGLRDISTYSDAVERIVQHMSADDGSPPGCLFTEMRMARPRLGPTTKAQLGRTEQARLEAFAAWFSRCQKAGEVVDNISPESAARYIDAQFTTMLLQLGAGEDAEQLCEHARWALSVLQATS